MIDNESQGDEEDDGELNYFSMLEYLLGELPGTSFTADSAIWCESVWKLQNRYEDDYPELLGGFFFTERPPIAPTSKEVSDFLVWITTGRAAGVWNPEFGLLEVRNPEEIKEAHDRIGQKLTPAQKDALRKMAAEVSEALVIVDKR